MINPSILEIVPYVIFDVKDLTLNIISLKVMFVESDETVLGLQDIQNYSWRTRSLKLDLDDVKHPETKERVTIIDEADLRDYVTAWIKALQKEEAKRGGFLAIMAEEKRVREEFQLKRMNNDHSQPI